MHGSLSHSRRAFLRTATLLGAGVVTGLVRPRAAAWAAEEAPATPDAALARLVEGNRRFVEGKIQAPNRNLERVKAVAPKQTPFAAFLSCADSRVPVEIIFDQGFGDLFVTRIAGNVASGEEIASLEFGTAVLGAKLLMVLGHSACGAVKAALEGTEAPGQITTLYRLITPGIDRSKPLDDAVESNVRAQARVLREGSTVIAGLLKAGKLKLVGGVYDLASGKVTVLEV